MLAPDAEPLRVLHLSDLHMMPDQRRKQHWVAALAATDPDLVVVTGDNIAHPEAVPGVLRALQPLLDFPGAFVFGSNDYRGPGLEEPVQLLLLPDRGVRAGRRRCPSRSCATSLVGAGWADLNNARTSIKAGGRSIELVGVDDPHIGQDDYDGGGRAGVARSRPVDRLTHSPEPRMLDRMAADGFELLLAGHTHGGQVCVPVRRRPGDQLRAAPVDGEAAAPLARLGRLAARLRRPGHPPDRTGPLRLPARGVTVDPDPALTGDRPALHWDRPGGGAA